jgi:hypothetical protein
MRRYYFHFEDGYTQLDDTGTDFPDIGAVRNAAITNSGEILRDGANQKLWDGTPWRMWVTDQADGKGEVFCELHFSAAA